MKKAVKQLVFVFMFLGCVVVFSACNKAGPQGKAPTLGPPPGPSAKLIQQAQKAVTKGDYPKAKLLFDQAKKNFPKDPFAWASAGAFHAALGDQEAAILALEKTNQLGGPYGGVEQSLAALYFKKGLPVRTTTHARAALKISSELPLAWLLLADSELVQGNYAKAHNSAKKAIARFPNDSALLASFGESAWYLNNSKTAKNAFQKALQLAPANARAAIGLGRIFESEGKANLAIPILRKTLKHRSNPDAQIALSRLLLQNKQTAAESLKLAQQAYLAMPDNPDYKLQFALALLALGKLKESRVLLEELVRDRPLALNPWLALERVYFRQKEWARSEAILEALLGNPDMKLSAGAIKEVEIRLAKTREKR